MPTLRCTAELDGFRAQLRDQGETPTAALYQALLKQSKGGPVIALEAFCNAAIGLVVSWTNPDGAGLSTQRKASGITRFHRVILSRRICFGASSHG